MIVSATFNYNARKIFNNLHWKAVRHINLPSVGAHIYFIVTTLAALQTDAAGLGVCSMDDDRSLWVAIRHHDHQCGGGGDASYLFNKYFIFLLPADSA